MTRHRSTSAEETSLRTAILPLSMSDVMAKPRQAKLKSDYVST